MKQHRRANYHLLLLFLLLAFVGMFVLNRLTPPTLMDDVVYRCEWQTDPSSPAKPITTAGQLLSSQLAHYQMVNGRAPVHLVAQAFLAFVPKWMFDALNAFLFILLVYGCARYVRCRDRLFSAILFAFLFFVVIKGFQGAMLWTIGSFNYLWVLTSNIVFLLALRFDCHRSRLAVMLPLAFFSGWSHEGLSLPLSFAFLLELLRGHFRPGDRRLLPVLCYMMGTGLCLLSPGLWGRAGADGIALVQRLQVGCYSLLTNVRITWLLLLVWLSTYLCRRDIAVAFLRLQGFLLSALLAALAIVLLCGTNLDRTAFHADFLASLLLVSLFIRLRLVRLRLLLLRSAFVAMVLVWAVAVPYAAENRENYRHCVRQIAEGRQVVAVRQVGSCWPWLQPLVERYTMKPVEFGFYCCYMAFDCTDTNLRCAAALHHRPWLVFLPEDVLHSIHEDPQFFRRPRLDAQQTLYTWLRTDTLQPRSLQFRLKPEHPHSLPFWKRPFVYHSDTYEMDDFHYQTVVIAGRPYLFFTRPTTNIFRRIDSIECR